ncbi:hypothetical protein NQ314_007022, partial [Rhamnusium bicolor]
RPTKIELSGVRNHVVQGTNVLLICDVHGARPAAAVRWENGTTPITNESLVQTSPEDSFHQSRQILSELYREGKKDVFFSNILKINLQRDGTYTTKSSLVFKASHFENGRQFYCYAENDVMQKMKETEMHAMMILDVRRRKMEKNLTLTDKSKYVGGTLINPPLYVNNVTRDDMGEYTCSLKNEVGSETSPDSIFLNVQFAPDVEIVMEPSTPIRAVDKSNVLLECNITSGNPSTLLKARWFLDGQLMKEFPECNYTSYDENGIGEGNGGPFCGLDPSILSLERVDETFSGNYTCQGKNVAGWGPVSDPQELIVYYPPSPAKLRYYPSKVVKGASVTLDCTVDSEGRPDNVTYIWYRGSHQMAEITSSKFTIPSVRLETRSNFTCIAENDGGQSDPATVFINVNAPPAFIQKLPTYQGVLYSSQNINLTCIVECYPECSIIWNKDGSNLDTSNNLYSVITTPLPPDSRKNDFESINSTLIWNMSAWPGQKLNKTSQNSNYTCQSKANSIGHGVSSTIEIAVDYPPEELIVSPRVVNVVEKQSPSPVKCHGKGHPALSYQWKKSTSPDKPIISSNEELVLGSMNRMDTGIYVCEASNKHGTQTANVYFNVQFTTTPITTTAIATTLPHRNEKYILPDAPECRITHAEKDSNPALLCTVDANPQEVTFIWRVREANETFAVSSNTYQDGLKSYLLLDSSIDLSRTYFCIANNSVGFSSPCEKGVVGKCFFYVTLLYYLHS